MCTCEGSSGIATRRVTVMALNGRDILARDGTGSVKWISTELSAAEMVAVLCWLESERRKDDDVRG